MIYVKDHEIVMERLFAEREGWMDSYAVVVYNEVTQRYSGITEAVNIGKEFKTKAGALRDMKARGYEKANNYPHHMKQVDKKIYKY